MIVTECIAAYFKDQNTVQAVAWLQDDKGQPLYQKIKTATVKFKHNDVPMLTMELGELDFNKERGAFYVFFVNPPIQRYTFIDFQVELMSGETSHIKTEVRHDVDWQYEERYVNPMSPGKPAFDYTDDRKNPI